MNRMLYIVNFRAGKNKAARSLVPVTEYFTRNGWEVLVHPTLAVLDAKRAVIEKGSGYDLIVCSGGDGTLSEVISGLVELPERPILGYIPAGSANDTAMSLNLPTEPMQAAEIVLGGTPTPFDIGRFNDRIFVYVAAFGAFSDVSYTTPQNLKNNLGHLAYVLEGMRRLAKIHPVHMRVETDEGTFEDDFIFGAIANTLSLGGGVLRFDPERVALNDGLFEVLLIRSAPSIANLSRIISLVLNLDYSDDHVIYVKSRSVRCTSPEAVSWTVDGEDGGKHAEVQIDCLHSPITVMAGKPQ